MVSSASIVEGDIGLDTQLICQIESSKAVLEAHPASHSAAPSPIEHLILLNQLVILRALLQPND